MGVEIEKNLHLSKKQGFPPSAIFVPYRLRFGVREEILARKFFRRRNKIAATKQTPRIKKTALGATEKLRHYRVCLFFRRSEGVE